MSKQIAFVTGSNNKFRRALQSFVGSDVKLEQITDLDVPEIQHEDVSEIARQSVLFAVEKLDRPVMVTDAGTIIPALKGFPGPFVKYVNHYFTAEDYVRLMKGIEDRTMLGIEAVAYCEPGRDPVVITSTISGTVATAVGESPGTSLEKVWIPDGYSVTQSELDPEEMLHYWNENMSLFAQLRTTLEQL